MREAHSISCEARFDCTKKITCILHNVWHRVTYDPIETMRYNVINYADYDLVMEIVDR